MWEQVLKVYNVKIDRNAEGRAIATYQHETDTLILSLNKLMQDYNPQKVVVDIEVGVENPTDPSEFKLNDKVFLENMEKTHPEIPTLIMQKVDVDRETAEGILVSVNRMHNKRVFDATPEIETEEQLQNLYSTLAHEGTHFGQFRIDEIKDAKKNMSELVDALMVELKNVIVMKGIYGLVDEEYNVPNTIFNIMAKTLADVAFDTTVLETQPAILDGYNTKAQLKRRIVGEYVKPKIKDIMKTYEELFDEVNLTANDRQGLARLKTFAENEVPNRIKQYINEKVVLKSWEAVVGFDVIDKKSKARRKKSSKRTKKKRKRSGDNFKREKDEGLHGWFSRRGGKQKKGGKTQRDWIACGTCNDKGGPKPCGRADASKGRKRRCRPTCAACKTYKRRKGSS